MAENDLSREKVMTVPELAEYLKVHTSTVYRLLKRKAIPAFKLGSDWRFNLESVQKWCQDQERGREARTVGFRRHRS